MPQVKKTPGVRKVGTRYYYTVEGRGLFPTDMLRYDQAWPADSDSAVNIVGAERRRVNLIGIAPPTVGRWDSFMWIVVVD